MRFARLLSTVLLVLVLPASVRSEGPAYDANVAKQLVAVAYAAACEETGILEWTCPWCEEVEGAFAGLKPDAYVSDEATQGAAFTAWNESTDQIVVVYRSTVLTKWQSVLVDMTFDKVDFTSRDGQTHGKVHAGFRSAYGALDQAGVGASIEKLVEEHPTAGLLLVGHSLGGALSTIAAADLVPTFAGKPILVYSFGSPRVGDKAFASWFASLPVTHYRVTTADDPVPHTPKLVQDYLHVGTGQEIWYRKIEDTKPQKCPIGENGKCANTVKAPTNFAGAHATYLGHKFEQCGIGPISEVEAWADSALGKIGDVYDETKHGISKAGDAATKTGTKATDEAVEAAAKAKAEAEAALKKAKAKEKDGCRTSSDCPGFKGAGKKGEACCSGKCVDTKKDWAGVYYCPKDCVGAMGGKPGSCK